MYQKGTTGKFLTHTYNICKTWGSEPSNNRAETRSHSAVQENFSQQARAIMFQNPNDPCNFCLGGQCDSQSPGKAISRLSTRAPNPPSWWDWPEESSRLCNHLGTKINHYPPLLLPVLRQNVFGKGITVRSIWERVRRLLRSVRSTSQLHETQDFSRRHKEHRW